MINAAIFAPLAALGGVGFLLLLAVYVLPTIVGVQRKVVNVGSVLAINLLLGWTLIGWVVALAMALRTNPPYAHQQFWQPGGPGQAAGSPAGASSRQPGPSGDQAASSPGATPTEPGWYVDPWSRSCRRYWDGHAWTRDTRPL